MDTTFSPSGDADATVAARVLFDPEMNVAVRPGVQKWLTRFFRFGLESPEYVVAEAGTSHGQYIISGAPAAENLLDLSILGPTIIWAEHHDEVSEHLGAELRETAGYQPAGFIVAHAPSETFIDAFIALQISFASPIQTMLDGHGLGLTAVAREITKDW
ncbi:hypothetical protein JOF28_000121 [Leucobacter exalbidus]|uniref:Uncharacterized protein n=1 Tax=Leucobacter exalbidus TaxID=662960 RepID=A0A940PNX1_9MICO|nr:hypothetical protein [Leucobacter exalbidus]MBP1324889.1 hypothetical protein [Leucobacter exalbidus]